jgi:NAD(P)-dependent dehydrogenase (short-subunit alcohol dehydrogenase family)
VSLAGKRIVVVGGSAGIGYAIAEAAVAAGAHVTIASRSAENLERARARLNGAVQTKAVDVTDERSTRALFDSCDEIDHVSTTAAVVNRKPFFEVSADEAHAAFESKFWGQFYVARCAAERIRGGGSITLTSGISSRMGAPALVVTGAINAAIESLCRSLALALAPIRVNAVSPGYVDTPGHDDAAGRRRAALDAVARAIPAGRVGRPEEIARTYLYLMQSEFTTGTVVDIDGGHLAGRSAR